MKKWTVFLILAALLLTLNCPVYAADFELDDKGAVKKDPQQGSQCLKALATKN